MNWFIQSTWFRQHQESDWFDEWVICDVREREKYKTQPKNALDTLGTAITPVMPKMDLTITDFANMNRLVHTAENKQKF